MNELTRNFCAYPMRPSQGDGSYRVIGIVAATQVGVVIFGNLLVTAILKAAGYRGGVVPDSFFNSEALFVRHWGMLYLFLPVAWTVASIAVVRIATEVWFFLILMAVGIGVIFYAFYYYSILILNPYIM